MMDRSSAYNVALFVLDDLRADHLSCYGYGRQTTPAIDRFAAESTRFERCYTPTGWTLPACASIITGRMPDEHGLVDHNASFQSPKLGDLLGGSHHRVAITNNGNVIPDTISVEYLNSLGFERRPEKWKFFGWQTGFDEYLWTHREDHETPFQRAGDFLKGRRDGSADSSAQKPYFLFFHSNVVHDYHMGREYYLDVERWLGRPLHPDLRSFPDGPDIWRNPPAGFDRTRLRQEIIAKYDAGIRYVDARVGDLLALLDLDNTIVIVMSDHGEGLDPDRGRVHHCGRLHQDLLHVPLIVHLPRPLGEAGGVPGVEPRIASTLDVVPTVLRLLGRDCGSLPGQFLFDLPAHRRLSGIDRGYIYWDETMVRDSYDTCEIDLQYELTYPLKSVRGVRNSVARESVFNLAYDPLEEIDLRARASPATRAIPGFEPITFVVAVNDRRELQENLLQSPVTRSDVHQWLFVDNHEDSSRSISAIYEEAAGACRHDLVFYLHQDVYLPPGWEETLFQSLSALDRLDPAWGVIGAVGAVTTIAPDGVIQKQLRGHWSDPFGYHRLGPLPAAVDSLDELWLGVRRSRGLRFDPDLPGFHCYGIDVSLSARQAGLKSYAIDAFVWHKFKDASGTLITRVEDSPKIAARSREAFRASYDESFQYIDRKWNRYRPFQTTSAEWL